MNELLEQIDIRLRRIEEILRADDGGKLLNVSDVAKHTGYSKSHIYKLASLRQIPHFKRGSRLLFNREDIDSWMKSNRVKTIDELESEAQTYCSTHK